MDNAHGGRGVLPFHPLLFAAFPPLALYANNADKFPLEQLGRPLGVSIVCALVVWGIAEVITRHIRKAAIVTSVVALAFFSYGHLMRLAPFSLQRIVAAASVFVLVGSLAAILRSRKGLIDATKVMNLASVVLIAPSVWTFYCSLPAPPAPTDASAWRAGLNQRRFLAEEPRVSSAPGPVVEDLPDVYYIILDAYGRSDRLKTFYRFDNSAFLGELQKRGFYVANSSTANYDQTTLCLASSLNMNYLKVPDDMLKAREDLRAPIPLRRLIDENLVAAHLRKLGYQYINVWAGLEETRVNTADLVLNARSKTTNFESETEALTALEASPQAQRGRYDAHREFILGAFRELEHVADRPSPKFVFAHILAPHPPFVLGPNGEPRYPKGPMGLGDASWLLKVIAPEEYQEGYIGQLQYINQRVLRAIDAVLAQSKKPPVIIVQGDHGSRMTLDWESQEKTDLREPFSILNAYYVPKPVRSKLYDTISPVNTFRILLSTLFGANLPNLPDRSFYSTASKPFDFSEVTPLVEGGK